jgi:hypothetical protein
MPAPPDRRPPNILEQVLPAFPLPPLNVQVTSSLVPQSLDVRWSSPSELSQNSCFNVVGVNVYRSFDSEYGPFFRMNPVPLGSNFWRDQTEVVLAVREDVSRAFTTRGAPTDVADRWMFRTRHKDIVIYPSPGAANLTNLNVQVTVNGVPAYVENIYADEGIVELRHHPTFDVTNQTVNPVVLPVNDSDVVLATYRYVAKEVRTDLFQRVFYRVTSVAFDQDRRCLVETPLERATASNRDEVEKLDWIWTEAIRRNKWILNQGGERVKLFIKKGVGLECGCISDTHRHPSGTCLVCYGTGVIGGYDGPFDIVIAPDDGDRAITRQNRGLAGLHTYDSWTGPVPLVSQRDFVLKMNGDRYGLGPVRMPSNRGMQLQQFFPIARIEENDIRYKVPVPDPRFMRAPETRWIHPGTGDALPMITDKVTIPDGRQLRGATVTWENISYGILFWIGFGNVFSWHDGLSTVIHTLLRAVGMSA